MQPNNMTYLLVTHARPDSSSLVEPLITRNLCKCVVFYYLAVSPRSIVSSVFNTGTVKVVKYECPFEVGFADYCVGSPPEYATAGGYTPRLKVAREHIVPDCK